MSVDFRGKKILIMGLGLHGGGVGTALFFASRGAILTITDLRTEKQLEPSLAKLKEFPDISYVLGTHRERDFLSHDLIIKNPGVLPTSPYLLLARNHNIAITTDIGIFLRICPALIIGVTGTRGKSTTCFLTATFLENLFKKNKKNPRHVFLGGNIRASALDFVDKVTPTDIVVLELSSLQLDDIAHDSWQAEPHERKSPAIAVITNIMRDHLNWHGTMQEYIKAKSVIFAYQKKDDMLFANGADAIVKKMTKRARSRIVFPRLPARMQPIVDNNLGPHYRSSVALAIGVAKRFGVPEAIIESTLINFHGLPGRQELIATIRDVSYINDTTATIPDAAIAAIRRFRMKAKKRSLILIAGGSDKKLKFSQMAEAIRDHVDYLITLPGTATEQLLHKLAHAKKSAKLTIQNAESMNHAVALASGIAAVGDYVLLSPGAASFGLFANEFDRGDQFVAAVKNRT